MALVRIRNAEGNKGQGPSVVCFDFGLARLMQTHHTSVLKPYSLQLRSSGDM